MLDIVRQFGEDCKRQLSAPFAPATRPVKEGARGADPPGLTGFGASREAECWQVASAELVLTEVNHPRFAVATFYLTAPLPLIARAADAATGG